MQGRHGYDSAVEERADLEDASEGLLRGLESEELARYRGQVE